MIFSSFAGTGRLCHRSRGSTIAGARCLFYYTMYVQVLFHLFVNLHGLFSFLALSVLVGEVHQGVREVSFSQRRSMLLRIMSY